MTISQYICSQVDFPVCKILNLETTKWSSSQSNILFFTINSPYTVSALLISIVCIIRIIKHVNSLHASIGKGEMRIFLYLHITSAALQSIIVGFEKYFHQKIYQFLVMLEISTFSSTFFSLFVGGLTIDKIYGLLGMDSSTFAGFVTTIYFVLISSLVFIGVDNSSMLVIPILLLINSVSLLLFISKQIKKLKKIKSDIWAYGILAIIFGFYAITTVLYFYFGKIIAVLSERNLDNLFFISVFTLITIMMIHKYWLNTCDFEVECLSLAC